MEVEQHGIMPVAPRFIFTKVGQRVVEFRYQETNDGTQIYEEVVDSP